VSLWPGFIMTDALSRMPPEKVPDDLRAMLPQFEKPEFSGLIIDALYRDPQLIELSGQALIGAELGAKYGIAGLKYALDKLGYFGGPVRGPLLPLDESGKREIDAMLAAMNSAAVPFGAAVAGGGSKPVPR